MTLEDFERELAANRACADDARSSDAGRSHHHHRHHHRHHRPSHDDDRRRRHREHSSSNGQHRHRHRHRSRSPSRNRDRDRYRSRSPSTRQKRKHSSVTSPEPELEPESESAPQLTSSFTRVHRIRPEDDANRPPRQHDAWMQPPSALDTDYLSRPSDKRRRQEQQDPSAARMLDVGFAAQLHERELNRHLHDVDVDEPPVESANGPDDDDDDDRDEPVDYTFGDAGAHWRMTKLRAVYRLAEERGRDVDDVAVERYGSLRAFDNAREEERELDRRDRLGPGYVGPEKPSGELYEERRLSRPVRQSHMEGARKNNAHRAGELYEEHLPTSADTGQGVRLRAQEAEVAREEAAEAGASADAAAPDLTAFNRLRARMMKARLRSAPDANALEAEYNAAVARRDAPTRPEVAVLGPMESRMLAGQQRNEAKPVSNRRGRERGQMEENEDMSIEDMVREERRTKGRNEGLSFADQISRDPKFDNDLDYMDENANRLARHAIKSDSTLKAAALNDLERMDRILATCPLCFHAADRPPTAPVVSLATRTYLTLAPESDDLARMSSSSSSSSSSNGGNATTLIVPMEHHANLLDLDDDEWTETRNFMKALTRHHAARGAAVLFYENAAHNSPAHPRHHAALAAVPLPPSAAVLAPAFFREAILAADDEWAQHRKLIDTQAVAEAGPGPGSSAFRRSLPRQLPYFHVWFTLDGGLGHVVENSRRWPPGDLFARGVIAGILDAGPEATMGRRGRGEGKWGSPTAERERVERFRRHWRPFDWTRLLEGE